MRIALTLMGLALAGSCEAFDLQLDGWRASIDPATLAVTAQLGDGEPVVVSRALPSNKFTDLSVSSQSASWSLPASGLRVEFLAQGARLTARFTATRDLALAWPASGDTHHRALILPEGEGLYVPLADATWRQRMEGDCAALSGGLSMPFWSFASGKHTLTYFVRSELRSQLCLANRGQSLDATLTHDFQQRDGNEPYEIEIWFGGASPIAPALEYRERLRQAGSWRSLADKIRDHPEVGKLAGATHFYVWGDGRRTQFIDDLVSIGARHAWLGYDQDEFSEQTHAGKEFVNAAKAAGFLVGPYDSYGNAQDPATGDSVSRWPGKLYPEGCIVTRDGKPKRGFANRGCELSSEALARAEATQRPLANRLDQQLRDGANSYFLDVDAFGELWDDFSPAHPMTVFRDRENRVQRLRWARERGVVLGSEEGVAWSVSLIDFAHGAFSVRNKVLWAERKSFGRWWPADRPEIFFNPVEPSAEFRASKFDPAFRLPLYEAAFHDVLVATDRWDVPMAQFPSQAATRQLLELLYGVPSIWAMDRRLFAEWRSSLTPLLAFFQPLHERIATSALTSFDWLTEDRLVQRTRFGETMTLTANFGVAEFEGLKGGCIQTQSKQGKQTFCPVRHAAAKPPRPRP